MDLQHLIPFIVTGATVSLLHAALPTHWLPFVLAAKTQKWPYRKVLAILLIAGSGHILTTTAIGAAVVWFSMKLNDNFEKIFILMASFSVFCFGVYYIVQFFQGKRHSHCSHSHPHEHDYNKSAKDGWAVLSLLSLLTFSPCESFLPVYMSAWQTGWFGFFVLSAVLAVGTLTAMVVFTSIAYYGMKQMRFQFLENYEKLIIGSILILLSVLVYFMESSHQHG
jgi:nickel/cobalt transporter (NicO) family protein